MPQQDYVKTARPAPRTRKKAAAKKPLPALLIVIIALLTLSFAGGLWYISHLPSAEQTVAEEKPADVKKQDDLPPKPAKEPYTYIKELETKEIQVEAAELAAKAPATMYCGSFNNEQSANQLKAKIAFAGISAQIKFSSNKYRVVVGPYVSRRQAQNDRNKLQREKIANCWIPIT